MIRTAILIILTLSITTSISQINTLRGRVLIYTEPTKGVTIKNSRTKEVSVSDSLGFYVIKALKGDTVIFRSVGVDQEQRIVIDPQKHLNVILINKQFNDGFILTHKQFKRLDRRIQKRYRRFNKEAEQKGMWNY